MRVQTDWWLEAGQGKTDQLILAEREHPPCKLDQRDGRAYPWERDPTDYTFPYPWARLDPTPSRFSWEGNTKSKSEICFSSKSGQLLQSREEKIKLIKLFEVKEEEEIHSRCSYG